MTDPLTQLPAAIRAVAPHADAATWSGALTPPMRSSGITTPNRIAAFLGQIAVESGGFEATEEDLWYTTAGHIYETFSHAFTSVADAVQFIGQPQALANRVYANENGNTEPGDGWLFRGRGLIQITGRSNYTAFATAVHMTLDAAVAFAGTRPGAAASACWYWSRGNLNALADQCEIAAITRRINPAMEGAAMRAMMANEARAVMVPASLGTPPKPVISMSQTLVEAPIGGGSVHARTADDLNAESLAGTLNLAPAGTAGTAE